MNPLTLVKIRILIYTIVALATAWQTTMTDVIWDGLDWVQRSCLFAGIGVLWGNTMLAYFDKSLWKWDEARRLNGNGVAGSPPKP